MIYVFYTTAKIIILILDIQRDGSGLGKSKANDFFVDLMEYLREH